MNDGFEQQGPQHAEPWSSAIRLLLARPSFPVSCPYCGTEAVSAAWNITDILSRACDLDLTCSKCNATAALRITLPHDAAPFFPQARLERVAATVKQQLESISDRIRQYAATMPAVAFTTNPLWQQARWTATTFRWHPASEAPPIMGLVFDNAEPGKQLFREYASATNNKDEFEELRISIIEGTSDGQAIGYSVHLSPDPEALAVRATANDIVVQPSVRPMLSRWNRMYPTTDSSSLLPRFKREFAKHKEFLFAPAVRRKDGQLWLEPELGVVKTVVCFRQLSEITPDDIDAAATILPELIPPRRKEY